MSVFAATQAAFRFYADGTESGSSALDAQDTDIEADTEGGNVQVHLRLRFDETGSGNADGNATDDWQLEYSYEGGAYTPVTASSTEVQADTGSSLTDGNATTNRGPDAASGGIDDGAGTFAAGEQEDGDGEIADMLLTGNDFSESVWALLLISSALSDTDTLDFRCLYNGAAMTYTVTPRITIAFAAAAEPMAAYQPPFYTIRMPPR